MHIRIGEYNMAYMSDESIELYNKLLERGFVQEFCELISKQLNTTWTANRMLGYLRYLPTLREEDIVDEMLEILSDRERIMKKKDAEYYQGKVNELYYFGLDTDDEEC